MSYETETKNALLKILDAPENREVVRKMLTPQKVTVYVVHDQDNDIGGIFTTLASAELSFPGESIEEHELCKAPLPAWAYWHRGAAVYPDGTFEEWTIEGVGRGHVGISACHDHLNAREEPWDGHTQGHCGEHVSVLGTDRELLERSFQKHLAIAIARQNGICQSKYHQHSRCDGRTSYESSWNTIRAARRAA